MNTCSCRAWGFLFHFQLPKLIKDRRVQELKITCHLQDWVLSMSLFPSGEKQEMLKKSKQKEKKNHTNKQTNKHHYKPQNPPWNRLKDSSRNILVFTVVKSAFKHFKKIEKTVRKSDTVLRLPSFASTSVLSQKVSSSTPCACCCHTSQHPVGLPKIQCYVGFLLLFLQHQTKPRRIY